MRSRPVYVRIARYTIIALGVAAICAPLAHSGAVTRISAKFASRPAGEAGADARTNAFGSSLLGTKPTAPRLSTPAPSDGLPPSLSALIAPRASMSGATAITMNHTVAATAATVPARDKTAALGGTPAFSAGAAVGPVKTDLTKSGLKLALAKKPAAPLSVSIRQAPDGSPEDGILAIKGGTAPFTVELVGDYAPVELYRGNNRKILVPILAGPTRYRVTDSTLPFGSLSGYSFAAEGSGAEAMISGDTKFWVMNTANRMLRRYDAVAETTTVNVRVRGAETTSAVVVSSVAVRQSDDHVFVVFGGSIYVDPYVNRLIELDSSGSVVATITVPSSRRIQDVTFDKNDDIYVCDRGIGYGVDNRVRIVKLDHNSPYGVIATTQTVLPNNPYIGYPMANTTNMLDYQPVADKIIARINTGTFAVINPATLAIEEYRFSEDYAYTCMALNTSNEASVTLYTGGSGFNRPAFFGKQSGFLNYAKFLDPSIITSPTAHDWIVEPSLPAITDVAVDSNDYVYTIQHDGANGITRAYIVTPDGAAVQDIDLPDGTKIAVVQNDGVQSADHNADVTGGVYAASMNTGCFGCHYADLRKEHGDQVLQSLEGTAGAYRSMQTTPSGTFAQSSTTDDRCNVCHNDKLDSADVTMPAGKFNESYNTTVAAIVNGEARYSSYAKRCDGCHYTKTGTDGPKIAHYTTGTYVKSNYTDEFKDWAQGGGHNVGSMVASGTFPHEGSSAAALLGRNELPTTVGGLSTQFWTYQSVFQTGHNAAEAMTCQSCHTWTTGNGPQGAAGVINMDPAYSQAWATATDTTKNSTVCAKCHDFTTRSGSHGQHNSYACTSCHIGVPHGWKRPRLLRNDTDAAPYAVSNTGVDYLLGFTAAAKSGDATWDKNACEDSCGKSNAGTHNDNGALGAALWP